MDHASITVYLHVTGQDVSHKGRIFQSAHNTPTVIYLKKRKVREDLIAAQIDVFNPGLSSVLAGMGPHCQLCPISQLSSRKTDQQHEGCPSPGHLR
jgi:hypothetical protein